MMGIKQSFKLKSISLLPNFAFHNLFKVTFLVQLICWLPCLIDYFCFAKPSSAKSCTKQLYAAMSAAT